MRLFEAIVEANHRALAGDPNAGLRPDEFADSLPMAALTCIDPRLNPLFPEILGLPKEQFVWLRNAGNIVHGPLTSTMRSLALSCAIKGAREVAIIGHTDCQVGKTTILKLTEAFQRLGVERSKLPENLTEYFGLFASERQNVLTSVEHVRHSPLIGRKIPVHGLLVDVHTGKLEWLDNGYQYAQTPETTPHGIGQLVTESTDALKTFAKFEIGEMKFPGTQIGQFASDVLHSVAGDPASTPSSAPNAAVPPPPISTAPVPRPPQARPIPRPALIPPRIKPGRRE